ncbi:mCpol domain-containing protein [Saccharopolyspora flava]|uniref:mCpol domain-containing protein n=1 Tax=Saccharopolyspora flava TaxID=95161 RepID=UPI000B82DB7E|nr:mCpol domain-containing protein [Saccharopolyspora flava]
MDARDFLYWIGAAFFAGALPNIASGSGGYVLYSLTAIAVIMAFALWLYAKRKDGIGVLVHLPRGGGRNVKSDAFEVVDNELSKKHRDWFRSGPEPEPVDDRAGWALQTIQHRLGEAESRDGRNPPISLYIHCHHPEAFALGAKAQQAWHEKPTGRSADAVLPSKNSYLRFRVGAFSTFRMDRGLSCTPDVYSLDFSRLFRVNPNRTARKHKFHRLEDGDRAHNRLALIIHVHGEHDDPEAFKRFALCAAYGGEPNGYQVRDTDRCNRALCTSIPASELFQGLEKGTGEDILLDLFASYREQSRNMFGHDRTPVRVFTNGPALLAFALGAQLPAGSRIIEFSPSQAPSSKTSTPPSEKVIAIVDGDDIGNQMEHRLLTGNVEDAADYSHSVTTSLRALVDDVQEIDGARLISQGGDSAIFEFPADKRAEFEQVLHRIRINRTFHVSCGYGATSKEAFMALRLAKTTGKNSTVNHDEMLA